MSRTTSILLSVLGIVIVGGGAFLWFNRSWIHVGGNTNAANTNAVTNTVVTTNVSTANLNLSTPDVLKGTETLGTKLTVAGTELNFTTSSKVATYENIAAPAGKVFVVVYFDPIDGSKVNAVEQALETGAHLNSAQGTVALGGLKVATTIIKNDRGYLKFVAPSNVSKVALEIGTGSSAQRLPLAY